MEKMLPKLNLQLFSEEENKEESKEQNTEDKKDDSSMLEALKKQIELQKEQMEIIIKKSKEEKEALEKTLDEERRKTMTAEQVKQLEEEKLKKQTIDMQNELLEKQQAVEKELEKMREENKKKEFENKKLIEISKYPFLKQKIEVCKDIGQLEFLLTITDIKTEEARWKAENNANGSVLNMVKGKSSENVEPETPLDIVKKRIKEAEKEALEKIKAGAY
jgi:hypothetical protein